MPVAVDFKFYLYVVAEDGAQVAVIEYDPANNNVSKFGDTHFPDAQNPVRLDLSGCSVVQGGAVTPREAVTPIFEGAVQVSSTVFATVWGYDNPNAFIVDQPHNTTGLTRNHFIGGTAGETALLPQLFASGTVSGAAIVFLPFFATFISWELITQAGGGVAAVDFTQTLEPELLSTVSAFLVRQNYPAFLRYQTTDVLDVVKVTQEKFGKEKLNSAGLGFDRTTVVRHTEEFNDDIPGQAEWYGRDFACRMEGGAIQAHAKTGRVSRILGEDLGRELARGQLFSIPNFNITLSPIVQLPEATAQDGEMMGFEIGNSADGGIVALSAEEYTDGSFTNLGRVVVWRQNPGNGATNIAILEPPVDWTRSDDMAFGRFTEVNPAGDLIFISGKKGPGIAVFQIDENDNVTYWKTLTWAGYTARPDLEKGHEARFSEDGQTFILSTGAFFLHIPPPVIPGEATVPAQLFILQTTDDWGTFNVAQTITRPGSIGEPDVMTTLDANRDASVIGIANWQENEVYVFRTTDSWQSFTSYTLTNPSEYPFGTDNGSGFGVSMAVSGDGFRVFAGAPGGDVDYGSGVLTDVGSVEMYLYNSTTDAYVREGRVTPPTNVTTGANFGTIRFNAPGSRLSVVASGMSTQFLYGIHDDQINVIAEVSDAFVGSSSDTRWFGTQDTMIIANKEEDLGAKTDVGAFRFLDFAEEP